MCQSTSVNAACMAADPRSAVMPRRLDRLLIDETRLINNARYSRLVESRRFVGADKRPIVTPFVGREQNQEQKPKPLQKSVQLASSEHVFQVSLRLCHYYPSIPYYKKKIHTYVTRFLFLFISSQPKKLVYSACN